MRLQILNSSQAKPLRVLTSNIDQSINFVEDQLVGFLESRFVRKCEEYFICYLSSQSGCNRGCTFCHLTATGQTTFKDADLNDYTSQAMRVMRHYKNQPKAKYIHYNFMARGEALANANLLNNADSILWHLGDMAVRENLSVKFNISTIMPLSFRKSLLDVFKIIHPTIYYSFYSTNEDFRKQWMPGAMPVEEALLKLKEYQNYSKKVIKIHHAFIKGVNDSLEDVKNMCDLLTKNNLNVEFNLVRYNPASDAQGSESDDQVIQSNMAYIKNNITGQAKIIPRVGFDAFASCGMFVQ